MNCKICNAHCDEAFKGKVLHKYVIQYFICPTCDFMQTEDPYWLEEAYEDALNVYDTGVVTRNIYLAKVTMNLLIMHNFPRDGKYLDYAGGYGLLTRLMRDYGFDFYWADKYAENLVAKGFEYDPAEHPNVQLVTAFEVFEHMVTPMQDIEAMLAVSKNIFFSTCLRPERVPSPQSWWYYAFEHGQHVAFFSLKTLQYLAKKFQLNLYTNGSTLHSLTERKQSKLKSKIAYNMKAGVMIGSVLEFFQKSRSKIQPDNKLLIQKNEMKTQI